MTGGLSSPAAKRSFVGDPPPSTGGLYAHWSPWPDAIAFARRCFAIRVWGWAATWAGRAPGPGRPRAACKLGQQPEETSDRCSGSGDPPLEEGLHLLSLSEAEPREQSSGWQGRAAVASPVTQDSDSSKPARWQSSEWLAAVDWRPDGSGKDARPRPRCAALHLLPAFLSALLPHPWACSRRMLPRRAPPCRLPPCCATHAAAPARALRPRPAPVHALPAAAIRPALPRQRSGHGPAAAAEDGRPAQGPVGRPGCALSFSHHNALGSGNGRRVVGAAPARLACRLDRPPLAPLPPGAAAACPRCPNPCRPFSPHPTPPHPTPFPSVSLAPPFRPPPPALPGAAPKDPATALAIHINKRITAAAYAHEILDIVDRVRPGGGCRALACGCQCSAAEGSMQRR